MKEEFDPYQAEPTSVAAREARGDELLVSSKNSYNCLPIFLRLQASISLMIIKMTMAENCSLKNLIISNPFYLRELIPCITRYLGVAPETAFSCGPVRRFVQWSRFSAKKLS